MEYALIHRSKRERLRNRVKRMILVIFGLFDGIVGLFIELFGVVVDL